MVKRFALLVLLGIQALLLALSASFQSPTINEPAHLVAGLSHLQFGSFALYRVNPPLVRGVAAVPVEVFGYQPDWSAHQKYPGARPVFEMGENFFHANGRQSLRLLTIARWACIPFLWLGGWICFLWARDLFGPTAGLVACALWCFSPMVLGLGATIAPDAHAAAIGLAACYTFWRWLKNPTWTQTIVTGVVLGLAELSKTTFILFYPIWPLIWVVYRWGEGRSLGGQVVGESGKEAAPVGERMDLSSFEDFPAARPLIPSPSPPQSRGRREPENKGILSSSPPAKKSRGRRELSTGKMTARRWAREGAMLAVRMLIGIYVLNLGYLGEGSFTRLGEFRFVSELFGGEDVQPGVDGNRFENSWLAGVPVPFPSNYIIGIDIQQRDFEDFGRPSYLRGVWQEKGWWYYYAYAVLVKTPLGTLGLMLLSVIVCFTRFRPAIPWRDAMVLLTPPLVIFVVASMKSGFSHHSRYILPCMPFVFVWLGQFGVWMERAWSWGRGVWSARRLPHWLPSPRFGERGRGRGAGTAHAQDSNFDDAGAPSPLIPSPSPPQSRGRREPGWNGSLLGVVSALLLLWSIGSSLWVYPHSLSYFNELAGGPKHGPAHLLNSNIDWGQDLLFLEKWVAENADVAPVYMAFYNLYNPFDLEIEGIEPWPFRREGEWNPPRVVVPPPRPSRREDEAKPDEVPAGGLRDSVPDVGAGYYAISVNLLYDYPWPVRDREGSSYSIDRRPHGYLRSIEPVGWAGYSIRIFSAAQMRAAYAAPPTPPLWE